MTLSNEEIKHLGTLSRIDISDDEIPGLQNDFDTILGYIDRIREVNVENGAETRHPVVNVMREDEESYESGQFSDDILAEVPVTEDNFVKVQKIL